MLDHSSELFTKAQTLMPGGVSSPVRAFKAVSGQPFFVSQAKGAFLYDIDGNYYSDYICSWGAIVLGHAHPVVVEQVQAQVAKGLGYGTPNPNEITLCTLLKKAMPSLELTRLVSSGTEAVQSALRLARGVTNRELIVKFAGHYHGHIDSLLVEAGSGLLTFGISSSLGISQAVAQQTLVVPFNDVNAITEVFKNFGANIAAVIVEPVTGNMNMVLPQPNFLTLLRELCTQHGSLLIFDEIITGFRVALGGAQQLYKITPDLTCLGKIIGGGLPVAAFGGKKEYMEQLSPLGKVYQAGTLSGNPVTTQAGIATLQQIMQQENFYSILNERTWYFTEQLQNIANKHAIALTTRQQGGMFGFYFSSTKEINNYQDVKSSDVERFKRFFHHMLKRGHYFAPSAFEAGFISMAHEVSILDATLDAIEEVFKTEEL